MATMFKIPDFRKVSNRGSRIPRLEDVYAYLGVFVTGLVFVVDYATFDYYIIIIMLIIIIVVDI